MAVFCSGGNQVDKRIAVITGRYFSGGSGLLSSVLGGGGGSYNHDSHWYCFSCRKLEEKTKNNGGSGLLEEGKGAGCHLITTFVSCRCSPRWKQEKENSDSTSPLQK